MPAAKGGWDSLAKWRDLRMGEAGDLWHRALIDPCVLSVLGPVRGRRVLDVGCGNGYLTRRFMRGGAARAVGVDASAASIRLARRREATHPTGAEFAHADAARLARFETASFDRIVANMALMDIRDAEGTVREMSRLLAVGGRVVFSIHHPCFDIDDRSAWVVEQAFYRETIARKIEAYREERAIRVPWVISASQTAYTTAFHRTLSTYSWYLREADLAIVRMEEPSPKPELLRESPQGRFIAEIPLHLVVEAARLAEGARPLRRPARGTSAGSPRRGDRRSGSDGRRRGTGSGRRGSTPGS